MILRMSLAVVTCFACAPAEPQPRSGQPRAALTISQVTRNQDGYVGQRIEVFGRLHAQLHIRDDVTAQPGTEARRATLHLRNPESVPGERNTIDLYRASKDGAYEPLSCIMRSDVPARCDHYTPGSLMTIAGVWTKHRLPTGEVFRPGKGAEVIAWRTAYFLVVAADER